MGGFQKTASVRPGGVNPNDKTVMINPPRGVHGGGGVNENFSPEQRHLNKTRGFLLIQLNIKTVGVYSKSMGADNQWLTRMCAF